MFNNYSLFVYERIYLECLECIAIRQEKCTFTYYLYQFIMRHSKNHVLFILKLFHPVYSVTNVSIHYLVIHYISQFVSLSPSYSRRQGINLKLIQYIRNLFGRLIINDNRTTSNGKRKRIF